MRFLALLACSLSVVASAFPLRDNQYEFVVTVPAGFVRLQEDEAPGALHAFRREPAAEGTWAILSFRGIPRVLSQTEKLDPDHQVGEASARKGAAKSGATISKFEYREVTWKGFPLEVTVMRAEAPSGPSISFNTMLPLASGALMVQLVGSQSDEATLLSEFNAVVASVEAETNWSKGLTLNDARKLGERVGFAFGLGIPIVAAWLLFRKRPQKS